jgi:hypothetical protein
MASLQTVEGGFFLVKSEKLKVKSRASLHVFHFSRLKSLAKACTVLDCQLFLHKFLSQIGFFNPFLQSHAQSWNPDFLIRINTQVRSACFPLQLVL